MSPVGAVWYTRPMQALPGILSDRIRSGRLAPGVKLKYEREKELPSPDAVLHARGIGLGQGATTARSGPGAE